MVKGLVSALQFITSIPVSRNAVFEPRAMIPFFPVVGLILGIIVALFDAFAIRLWPAPVAAVLDTALLALLTGALHLDGLGDTADGLYGGRTRERALEIMKDSRIGAMGMVAVVFALAVKWGGLSALGEHRALLIVIVPSLARASMIFACILWNTEGRAEVPGTLSSRSLWIKRRLYTSRFLLFSAFSPVCGAWFF